MDKYLEGSTNLNLTKSWALILDRFGIFGKFVFSFCWRYFRLYACVFSVNTLSGIDHGQSRRFM